MFDLIIIGGGPAGSAAAVYAARKRLKTIFITTEWGGQSVVSDGIQNWIGTPVISGSALAESLKKHVLAYAGDILQVNEGEKVVSIEKDGEGFKIKSNKNQEYSSKAVLIGTGSSRRKLDVPGAESLEHKGLTYCASCDGPLFADMDVAVIGGGNAAFESAAQLLAYCKSVTLLHHSDQYKADQITVDKVLSNPKMKALTNVETVEVYGEKFVDGLKYKDKKTGEIHDLPVKGIFVEIGQIPNTDYVKNVVNLDQYGRIEIDPWTQKSNTLGIWAAGDCTNIRYHQNNIAAGDAVKAIEDIYVTLHTK